MMMLIFRANNVRLPKLPTNKAAAAIAAKRQAIRAKQAQVCQSVCAYSDFF